MPAQVLAPDAAAVRQEGLAAAREMLPETACPYPAGGWQHLDWRIGHASFWRRPGANELKAANRARDRARTRAKAAVAAVVAQPPKPRRNGRPVRVCRLDGCPARLTCKQREYCCWEHYKAGGGLLSAGAKGRAVANARPARPVLPSPPPAKAAEPARAAPPTPEMWRAACNGLTVSEMRLMGLDQGQVARVIEMQRRGGRIGA